MSKTCIGTKDTKPAGDGLGDYVPANTEDTKMDENKGGGSKDQANKNELNMQSMSSAKVGDEKGGKNNGGDAQTGRADEGKLDDEKGCCVPCEKFWVRYKEPILIASIVVLAFFLGLFVILFGVAQCKLNKLQKSEVTGDTTPMPGTPSKTPMPGTPAPSPPGAIIAGIIRTAENYTKALENSSSLDFKKLENKFIAAVMDFYAKNPATYIPYYERTIVKEFIKEGLQANVNFEIHFTQLDNDNSSPPDAHSVLSNALQSPQEFGQIRILGGNVDFQT
ncbi:uncharacterized protein LOC121416773 isoform X2 [Lytechinus variegatus]|uniref:uncharacterized protein LOC121416773 isoform X2 n=1 Tax=Lytechinus variegatus TaxID=7654 RepID=UPI001BB1BCC2|nr:uncharacterized protein LOC121416773 isoform X2 [Lytechinus variegatus]